jgi:hypothetical protein
LEHGCRSRPNIWHRYQAPSWWVSLLAAPRRKANPHITIQTWQSAESVLAHRLTSDAELTEAFEFAMSNPTMRMVMRFVDSDLTLEQFLAQKDRFTFVTFDPINQQTPPPLKVDLWWFWIFLVPFCFFLAWIVNIW